MGSHSTIYYPSAPALGIGIGLTGHRANMRPHSALLCYPLRSQSTLRTWEQPICRSVRSGFQRAPYRHPALEAPGSNAHPTGILPCAVCRVRAAAGDVFAKEGVGRLHACQRKQRPVTRAIPSLPQGPGPECDHGAAQAPCPRSEVRVGVRDARRPYDSVHEVAVAPPDQGDRALLLLRRRGRVGHVAAVRLLVSAAEMGFAVSAAV